MERKTWNKISVASISATALLSVASFYLAGEDSRTHARINDHLADSPLQHGAEISRLEEKRDDLHKGLLYTTFPAAGLGCLALYAQRKARKDV